ncbi:MAG: hypothetical protein HZA07_03760 [Nitrospirae bacterium]|nr:hypothetical protein [Nitrospirota bacterium]
MNDNPLIQSLKELCLFLADIEIEYMLVGGLATGIWGEPRATVDIDFLVSLKTDDFDFLKQRLKESERFIFIHDKPMIFWKISFLRATLKSNMDISVDFLFSDDDFKKESLKRREVVQVADFSVNISTPEDLIILKLLSGREQDRLDAEKILEMQKGYIDMEYMQRWSEKLGIVPMS